MRHEDFLNGVKEIVIQRAAPSVRERLQMFKLTYGMGNGNTRGRCFYGAWRGADGAPVDFVEVAAASEESVCQLAGTTIHEMAHVLAGHGAGHGVAWKEAGRLLGLLTIEAAGQGYTPDHFEHGLWESIVTLGEPKDGQPNTSSVGSGIPFVGLPTGPGRACPLGIGTRGGTSRGKGSGSRLRLYECRCAEPVKVRVASDTFEATCNRCHALFLKPITSGNA